MYEVKPAIKHERVLICTLRWLAGDCRFGPRCNFAHGEHELRKMPPKPGRYSQDTRERDIDKELTPVDMQYPYGRGSLDIGYRPMPGAHSVSQACIDGPIGWTQNVYSDYYPGAVGSPYPGSRGSSGYPGHPYAAGSPNLGYGNPVPTMVQPSGPLHVAPAPTNARDYYPPGQAYPIVGPNGWIMYRDPKSGEPYYHNHQSTVTQWKRPDEWPL